MGSSNEIIIKDLHTDLVRMRNELHEMNKYLKMISDKIIEIEQDEVEIKYAIMSVNINEEESDQNE
jgi:hypothetical protein